MNREIKFRGMSINGDWHYGLLTILKEKNGLSKEGCYISNSVGMPLAYHVRPDTVGEFTGILDFWEGDILGYDRAKNDRDFNFEGRKYFPIKWQPDMAMFMVEYGNGYRKSLHLFIQNNFPVYKKVGNIYENPELLK